MIPIIPLISTLLVTLFFFIFSSNLVALKGIPLTPPHVNVTTNAPFTANVLAIDSEHNFYTGPHSTITTWRELDYYLADRRNQPILLSADRSVDAETLVKVISKIHEYTLYLTLATHDEEAL